ncbi:MAG: hypothetical protein ACRECA_05875, partial [Pseudolabrys sp.]
MSQINRSEIATHIRNLFGFIRAAWRQYVKIPFAVPSRKTPTEPITITLPENPPRSTTHIPVRGSA